MESEPELPPGGVAIHPEMANGPRVPRNWVATHLEMEKASAPKTGSLQREI
jgi:hypothetical protein